MPFSTNALTWPEKAPDANLGYAIDLSVGELDPGDSVVSASVAISPSGDPLDLLVQAPVGVVPFYTLTGDMLVVWLAQGIPGRVYLVKVLAQTAEMATLSIMVSLPITRTMEAFPPPEPVSMDFTPPVNWHP